MGGCPHVQTGHVLPQLLERIGAGAHDEVRLIGGHLTDTHANDLDKRTGLVTYGDLELVIAGERETEGVETRPEVGARGGNAHVHGANGQSH